ncbi:MAG: hypothetical protein ISS48_04170 [Candidatus Aenigmarchaeota archaeon]|nr:hypothetical protein [Candidatus Aenigmarchaeota archaeon]
MVYALVVEKEDERCDPGEHNCRKGGRYRVTVITSVDGVGVADVNYKRGRLCTKCEGIISLDREEFLGILDVKPLFLGSGGVYVSKGVSHRELLSNLPKVTLGGS